LNANLFSEGGVGCGRIYAHSEHLSVRCINLSRSDSRLDRLELFGSTTGKGKDVNGKEYILLSAIITKFDGLPLIAEKGKVRSNVSYFEIGLRDFIPLLS